MEYVKTDKNIFQISATVSLIGAYVALAYALEYWSQLANVDNIIGALPLVLLTGIVAFWITLIWKRHENAETSTFVFALLSVLWALLLLPAWTGNWHPLLRTSNTNLASPDFTIYAPFAEGSQVAKLPAPASLTLSENLPILDGAIALYPLYAAFVHAVYDKDAYNQECCMTNTLEAYRRIISGDCDIIFVAGASKKQSQAAHDAGVELVFTPIGREAFVFLVGKSNPIENLSRQQLRNIYSGKTTHWRTLGWKDGGRIIAFQRPEGSGSQTGLQAMMRGLPIQKPQPLPDGSLIGSGSLLQQVSVEWQGVQPALGYSYRYFATTMHPNPDAKLLAIDGVYPSNETIADGSYPFSGYFYAVTNGQPNGNAKRLIDWILTDEGQYLIEQTGYVPLGGNR